MKDGYLIKGLINLYSNFKIEPIMERIQSKLKNLENDGGKVTAYISMKIQQIFNNIRSCSLFHVFFFYLVIPFILLSIYYIPESLKETHFILNTSQPTIGSIFLNEYTHSTIPHILGNLKKYFIAISIITLFENNKKVLWYSSLVFLIVVPIISSGLTIFFYDYIGKYTVNQGFSGITAAFVAYAMYSFVKWFYSDISLDSVDWKNSSDFTKWVYLSFFVLLLLFGSFIIVHGLNLGLFIEFSNSSGSGISNGIAHFGGYIAGLVVPLIVGIKYRVNSDYAIFFWAIIILSTIGCYYYEIMTIAKMAMG